MAEGHVLVGLKGLNLYAHAQMFLRTLHGTQLKSPVLKMAEKVGAKPGSHVILQGAREVLEGATGDDLAWSKIWGIGKIAKTKHGHSLLEIGRAVRQTPDQVNRLNLWGDEFGRLLKKSLRGSQESV